MKDLYNKMLALVITAHDGQFYGEYEYIYHLFQVRDEIEVFNIQDPDEHLQAMIVALGHDIIEDTYVTSDYLLEKGFSNSIVEAIVAITKFKGETRKQYLRRCKNNAIALIVKKADTMVNLRNSYLQGDHTRIKKYTNQLEFLFKEEK